MAVTAAAGHDEVCVACVHVCAFGPQPYCI